MIKLEKKKEETICVKRYMREENLMEVKDKVGDSEVFLTITKHSGNNLVIASVLQLSYFKLFTAFQIRFFYFLFILVTKAGSFIRMSDKTKKKERRKNAIDIGGTDKTLV